jgi:dipeptidyl aminopeptidase/acylaminoacyl peptidase
VLQDADGRARNAESLAVHPVTQQVVVVDKSRRTAVWVAPPGFGQPSPAVLERVADLEANRVSGAAFSRDGRQFVVRDQTTAYLWDTSSGSLEEALAQPPRTVTLPAQRQGESVTFSADGQSLLVGSEGARTAVWAVPLAADAPPALPSPVASTPPAGPTAAEVEQSARQEVRLISGVGAAAVLGLLVYLGLRRLRARRAQRPPAAVPPPAAPEPPAAPPPAAPEPPGAPAPPSRT